MNIKCSYSKIVNVADLKPFPNNENKHSQRQIEALAKIIANVGQRSPIVVSLRSGYITKGHGRLEAIKLLGWDQCAIDEQDYKSELEEIQDRVADNEIARYAEFDLDVFKNNITDINLDFVDLDMDLMGILDLDFNIDNNEVTEDNFDVSPAENPITIIGDLYEIGEHRLLCGDSTLVDDVERLMDGRKADMVLTDPPYNVDYTGGTKDALKILNDKKSNNQFYQFLCDAFHNLADNIKRGGSAYIFHADTEGLNFRSAFIASGFLMKQCLIWEKNSLVMGRADYQWMHEPILYGWLEGAKHTWNSDRKQTTILKFNRPSVSKEHPTMKPVSLVAYLVNNSSKQDDIVLDTFLGSGTTMVASHQLNRKCYGMELDPKYCDVIIKRMLNLDSELEVKRNGIDCKEDFLD